MTIEGVQLSRSQRPAGLRACLSAAAISGVSLFAQPASAHPHVFVTTEATVIFERGSMAAIDHVWTFDEFYTAMAIDGLDTNKDGKYSRDELTELAKTNMEGLKEFSYFTYAKLGAGDLKFAAPTSYHLEHNNGVLSLHFRLPLETPVLTEAKGFSFSVSDPSYFIGFEMAAKHPVKLSEGAPKGCKIQVGAPQKEAADTKRLGEAFFEQLGGGGSAGFGVAKTAAVVCSGS